MSAKKLRYDITGLASSSPVQLPNGSRHQKKTGKNSRQCLSTHPDDKSLCLFPLFSRARFYWIRAALERQVKLKSSSSIKSSNFLTSLTLRRPRQPTLLLMIAVFPEPGRLMLCRDSVALSFAPHDSAGPPTKLRARDSAKR